MKGLAHTVHPFGGIYHDGLRRLKFLFGFQPPGEAEGVDTDHHAGDIISIHLGLGQKIAGVNQGKAHHLALKFVCRRPLQHHKRIMKMAGASSCAVYGLDALLQDAGFYIAFSPPCAGKLNPFIIGVGQV